MFNMEIKKPPISFELKIDMLLSNAQEQDKTIPYDYKSLLKAIDTIPVLIRECERNFCAMNEIVFLR